MALTKYIKHYEGFDVTITQSVTTTSFTPENNSLLVALITCKLDWGIGVTFSQTVSGGGLTWNFIGEHDTTTYYGMKSFAYYAEVDTAASMTFTFDSNQTQGMGGPAIIIYNFTGYDTSDPIGGYYAYGAYSPTTSTPFNGILSSTPRGSSYIVAAAAEENGTISTGAGWTLDQSDVLNSTIQYKAQSRTGWTSKIVNWNDISGTGYYFASIGVEVKAPISPLDFPSSPSEGDRFEENDMTFYYKNGVWRKVVPNNLAMITHGIDNDGSALVTGNTGPIYVPKDFEIVRWTLIGDQSGSANVDLWSCEYGTTPTAANTMTGNVGMTISSATANQSGNTMSWVMDKINAGNVVTYNVQSVSTITRLTVNLFGIKGQ